MKNRHPILETILSSAAIILLLIVGYQTYYDITSLPTPQSDLLFSDFDRNAYHLAQKIERQRDISERDLAKLPQGAINQRYGQEITLLFHALSQRNVQAIDMLIGNGADVTMVDRPSKRHPMNFMNYLGMPGGGDDEAEDLIFINELIKIYLKHGGDPNYIQTNSNNTPLVLDVAIAQNYKCVDILVKAGANIWQKDGSQTNLVDCLAMDPSGYNTLLRFVDHGLLDDVKMSNIIGTINHLSGYTQRGDDRSIRNRSLAMRILKRYPKYQDDQFTKRLFGGSIPWAEIKALAD
ncbi:hypothetical protein N5853_09105 [Bartonella sp. HY329]|uniref:hypothetical protein n=1 Tax=unclassified Bartonella TaxID=2645622 RepID=UPI0021CA8438|nr:MULTISPECIES: hypothetical protein [unclassified Bartonella]UXM94264.1 hypothetical protein N5853_09105 [Bartonella sp. HY329]UXN08587.1 hypothetical protein N5852_09115 [Bartonella sp. HY328]